MNYRQTNPVPLPPDGALHSVRATLDTLFDWEYALRRQELLKLYEKGKQAAWNAADLDWSVDVDLERLATRREAEGFGSLMNDVLKPPRPLEPSEVVEYNMNVNAFMLSQFLHGEQGALMATAKIVQQVPWEEAKLYAAIQVADEARHVEVYHRYLTEKLGISYEVHPSLGDLLDQIVGDSRWDVTYLGMQILVEGLALAAFGMIRLLMPSEPLIQDITARIMQDESRHVAFGVLSLQHLYTREMAQTELREREEFTVEAIHLLHDRLLMQPVFERLGWERDVWVDWMPRTPFMRGFRQMLFSKIVPNLKRLGLLTPRVREACRRLELLRFEDHKDSLEEPEVTPPRELVDLLSGHLGGAERPSGPWQTA